MGRTAVLDDYELTNTCVTSARRAEVLELFVAAGMTAEAGTALLEAPRWLLGEALEWLDARYGGLDGYLTGPMGLGPGTLSALRDNLLE